MTTTVTINNQRVSRKAAQAIIKDLRVIQGKQFPVNTIAVKGNAKQELLLIEIERINSLYDISNTIAHNINLHPYIEKTKAARATKTTKTIGEEVSERALLKSEREQLAREQTQAAKRAYDAESRLAEVLAELSETKEALAYAHQTITSKTFVVNADDAVAKTIESLHVELANKELMINKLKSDNANLVDTIERNVKQYGEQLDKLKQAAATVIKPAFTLVAQLPTNASSPRSNECEAQASAYKASDSPAHQEHNVSTPPKQTDKPKAIAIIESLEPIDTIDGVGVHSMSGLASVFRLEMLELQRMIQRLTTQGFINCHIGTPEMLAKFTDAGLQWKLNDGSFFVSIR